MKKTLILVSAILITILITTAQPSLAASCVIGDFTDDGQVNSDDAIFLLMHSQFPNDAHYTLNQKIYFQKGNDVSSDDAIYLLMYTQFPSEYPINEHIMKMKYESIGVYESADASSNKVGEITYGNSYTVSDTVEASSIEWIYVKDLSGWTPSGVFVDEDVQLPETYSYTREYIEPGSVGDTVKEMQEAMNNLGYRSSRSKKLVVDGIYGSDTEYAVELFQDDYNFISTGATSPDGRVDPYGQTFTQIDNIDLNGYGATFTSETNIYLNHLYWEGSVSADSRCLIVHTTPDGWSYAKDIDAWVKSDKYVDRVSLLPKTNDAYTPHTINIVKNLLNNNGFYNESGNYLTLNGTYDEELYYALCNFQGAVGLYRIGDMPYNGKTWNYLNNYTKPSASTSDEETIWNKLYSLIGNSYGVAGVMGNLYAESSLKPNNLQNNGNKKLGLSDEEFTSAFDSGTYSEYDFIHDSYGYGLAQWTFWSRKQALVNYKNNTSATSIGDLNMQLNFLCIEISNNYSGMLSQLKNATSVKEASDIFLTTFERPADQSDSVKEKRAGFGLTYYNKYS